MKAVCCGNLNNLFPTWQSFPSLPQLCRRHVNSSLTLQRDNFKNWRRDGRFNDILICRRERERERKWKCDIRVGDEWRWRRVMSSVKLPSALSCAAHDKSSWCFHLASLSTTPHSTWSPTYPDVVPLFPAICLSIWPDGSNRSVQHGVIAHCACRVAAIKNNFHNDFIDRLFLNIRPKLAFDMCQFTQRVCIDYILASTTEGYDWSKNHFAACPCVSRPQLKPNWMIWSRAVTITILW